MIHWAWLIAAFAIGSWIGAISSNRGSTGVATGVVGTILAFFALS